MGVQLRLPNNQTFRRPRPFLAEYFYKLSDVTRDYDYVPKQKNRFPKQAATPYTQQEPDSISTLSTTTNLTLQKKKYKKTHYLAYANANSTTKLGPIIFPLSSEIWDAPPYNPLK